MVPCSEGLYARPPGGPRYPSFPRSPVGTPSATLRVVRRTGRRATVKATRSRIVLLHIVVEIPLCFHLAAHAEDVRRAGGRVEPDEVRLAVPEVAGVADEVVDL